MARIWIHTVLLVLLFATAPVAALASEDVLERAMKDELARSLAKLQIAGLEKPYFIAYRVDESRGLSASATLGSLLASGEGHSRILHVELRVGSYELDNTNFLTAPSFARSGMVRAFGGMTPLPLDDDYQEIRRQIWLATDAAYKQAVENLEKKKAALQNKTRTDELPDFSKEEVVEIQDDRPPAEGELTEMEDLATGISALLGRLPHVFTSEVEYSVSNRRTLYVNSEGTTYSRTTPRTRFTAVAATQAEDGMELQDFVAAYGRYPIDLPGRDELAKRIGELGDRLAALRTAGLLDRYNGPVLFEGQAAAELFAQAFAPELVAHRRPLLGDERMARYMETSSGGVFQDRLGGRVLPRFLNVTDDATRSELDGQVLQAGYKVDDEGVPSRPTKLIERGYLKTLLNGRAPVEDVTRSSGNRRGGVVPSNLIVESDRGLSQEALRQELLLLINDREAEYGVVVRRLGNPQLDATDDPFDRMRSFAFGPDSQQTRIEPLIAAYKVYPDGREELLRNVEISGLAPATFKEIVAAGEKPSVTHLPFSPRITNPFDSAALFARGFGSSGGAIVSVAVPALLFEEVTLKKPSSEIPRLPVVPRPSFGE